MSNNTKKSWGWKSILNLISFVAICCIGISLLIGKIGVGSIAGAFRTVAEILAYLVTAIAAFNYVIARRHWAYYVVWIVCVVLIIVLMVIN